MDRGVALWNIRYICPPISTALINTYRHPARLFVLGGLELVSGEGTTQGCPFGLAMYALSSLPLIKLAQSALEPTESRNEPAEEKVTLGPGHESASTDSAPVNPFRQLLAKSKRKQPAPVITGKPIQGWIADDSQAAGKLPALRRWWDILCSRGPDFGYHVNPDKSYLVVKPHLAGQARDLFDGTGVKIVDGAHRDLGAVVGIGQSLSKICRG